MSAYVPELDRIRLPQASLARVLSVCFEPTNRCPGKCPYCLIEEHDDDQIAEVLRLVIDRLLDHGTLRVGFGGGEPLVRGEVFQLGARVRERGAGALLRTSGMFPLDASGTRESFDWVDLSLDSSDPDIFRRCRPGVPFDVLVGNIGRLIGAGVRARVSILVTSRNVATIGQTVRWLAAQGVEAVGDGSRGHGTVRRSGEGIRDRSRVPARSSSTSVKSDDNGATDSKITLCCGFGLTDNRLRLRRLGR